MHSDEPEFLAIREVFEGGVEDGEAAGWAEQFGDDVRAAWAACPRGGWLLRLASAAGVDARSFARAGLSAAEAALDLAPDARALVALELQTLLAWTEGRASDDQAEQAVARANLLANTMAGMQGDPPSPAQDERLRRSLAVRSLARSAEGRGVWPTAADLARSVAQLTAEANLNDFERECATRIRRVISPDELAERIARPPRQPPPEPCYVEVRFAAPEQWQRLRQVWDLAAAMKRAGDLDSDAGIWTVHAQGEQLDAMRDAIDHLASGEYEMLPAALLDPSTGRLPFDPWAFPYGGVDCMRWLAGAFGCEVVACDDGTGRQAGLR
jgi:hypothetical protein